MEFGDLNSAIPAFALKGVNIPRMCFRNVEQLLGPDQISVCQKFLNIVSAGTLTREWAQRSGYLLNRGPHPMTQSATV